MLNRRPVVGIVVVNYNGLSDTLECLDSLSKIGYHDFLAFVVDNHSDTDELSIIRNHPLAPTCIQNTSNSGFARASNEGIESAMGENCDFVLLLNNDTVVKPDFLEFLMECMERHPNVGLAQPKIVYYQAPAFVNTAGGRFYWNSGYVRDLGLNRKSDAADLNLECSRDWVSGCAMLIRRTVIESVSLLDAEAFPLGGEDYDFSWRAHLAGYGILYCPRSVVLHKVSKTRRTIGARRVTTMTRNIRDSKISLFEKYSDQLPLARICYSALFKPLEALGYVLRTPDLTLKRYYINRLLQTVRMLNRGRK